MAGCSPANSESPYHTGSPLSLRRALAVCGEGEGRGGPCVAHPHIGVNTEGQTGRREEGGPLSELEGSRSRRVLYLLPEAISSS